MCAYALPSLTQTHVYTHVYTHTHARTHAHAPKKHALRPPAEIDAEMAGADWRDALRLSLMDASTGAVDGSIRFELDRPYAAGLEDIVKRYDAAKAAIDPKLSVPVGYGDLYALGAKVLMNRAWREDYAGLTERFEARSTYKRGAFAEAGGDVDADEGFKGAFLKLYSPVDLGPDGTPIQLGRADAEGPSPEEAAALVPVGNAALESDAAAYREWFAALGVKFLALAPLAPYLDTTGAAAAAFKADGGFGGLAGFVERNERDVAQPGLVERRVVYAYSDVMTIGSGLLGQGDSLNKFNQDKYAIPAYVDGVGWTTVPPMKGVDYAKLYKVRAMLVCVCAWCVCVCVCCVCV